MSTGHKKHYHGASPVQSVDERIGHAHHSEGDKDFGHNPKNRAVNHAHHGTGMRGFFNKGESPDAED